MMKYLEGKHSDVGTTWQMAQPKKKKNKQIQIAQSITSQRRRKRKTQMKYNGFLFFRIVYIIFSYLSSRKLNFSILNIN